MNTDHWKDLCILRGRLYNKTIILCCMKRKLFFSTLICVLPSLFLPKYQHSHPRKDDIHWPAICINTSFAHYLYLNQINDDQSAASHSLKHQIIGPWKYIANDRVPFHCWDANFFIKLKVAFNSFCCFWYFLSQNLVQQKTVMELSNVHWGKLVGRNDCIFLN